MTDAKMSFARSEVLSLYCALAQAGQIKPDMTEEQVMALLRRHQQLLWHVMMQTPRN